MEELSKLGRANMMDYMRVAPDGVPVLDWSKLSHDQAAALIEVTVGHFLDGRGGGAREVRRIRFKLANKIDALELLGKHHKIYVERHEHDFRVGLADRLAAALARVDSDERSDDGEAADQVRRPDFHLSQGGHARRAVPKPKRARAR